MRIANSTSIARAFLFACTATTITLCVAEIQSTEGERSRTAEEQGAILDTIAQINHINWVVNTIKTYNNPIVLEIESQKVSPGNLWLDRIPDRTAMERIKKILNTLHELRMDEREMQRWREDFEERRDRERKTFRIKASKQAVDAMTGKVRECCSQWSWKYDPVGSIAAVVNAAFNVVHCPVSLYNDYDNFVYAQTKAAKDKEFDFDTAKLNLLHKQNLELLEDQWRFIAQYKLDDKLRVSDADINRLLACLRDDSPSRIYTRLAPMSERFSLFPEYWYYLSCVAMETGHFKEGLEACDQFFKTNRHIFRDDPMEGTVAFNKAFMLPKTDSNKPEIRKCLELAWKNNILRGDWQLDYLVAIMYKGIFNEQAKAEMMLEHAVALIEQETHDRVRYGGKAGVTLKEGLFNCRNALHELRGEALAPIEKVPMRDNLEEFASKLFDEECGGGLLALTPVVDSAYYILLLPVADIPELKPEFTIDGESVGVGFFGLRYKRVLKEMRRISDGIDNIVACVFPECSGFARSQRVFSCSNGKATIFFSGAVDGYSGIQFLPQNGANAARKLIEWGQIDIHWEPCIRVWKIEKLVVGNKTYTRQSTRKAELQQ